MKLRRANRSILTALVLLFLVVSMLGLTACSHEDEKEVRVFSYGDYMDPDVPKQFTKETGIKVVLDTFDTAEEMYPVIKNRAGVYDVIITSDYMIEKMKTEDLLQPVDTSSMKYYKNIGKKYLEMADRSYDPGNKYSVPYQWGTLGIMYNKTRIKEGEITSWNDLWKSKYKNKLIVQDSMRDTLAMALKAKGYSLNSIKESELEEATDYLIQQKPLVYKYATDSVRDLLVGNSADLGVIWNGEVLYSQELNPDMAYVVPKEGTEVFIDSFCIPKNAFHKANAEKFIDYMNRGDVAYKNFEYLTYSTPNEAAREMMDEETKNNPNLFPSDELLDRCESLRDIGPEGTDLVSGYWKKFKSK